MGKRRRPPKPAALFKTGLLALVAAFQAGDHRIDSALARQFGKYRDVAVFRLARHAVRARGNTAELVDRAFRQLILIGEQSLEHGFSDGFFKFETNEFAAVPDDAAKLRLK